MSGHLPYKKLKPTIKLDKKTKKLKTIKRDVDVIWAGARIIMTTTDKDSEFYNKQEFKVRSWTDDSISIEDSITKVLYECPLNEFSKFK